MPHLYSRSAVLSFTCALLCLAACSDDYPLVANGLPSTAEISALDNQGHGNFAIPIPPKSCLLAFKDMPDLATMQVRVVMGDSLDRTFTSAELQRALGQQDFSKGIFVADASGIRFVKDYDCDSKLRSE